MVLLSYTRQPIDNIYYDPRIAYSMHLALSEDGVTFEALNHNSGVLFAKAVLNPDGTLHPKTLREPVLYEENGLFHVAAILTGPEGEADNLPDEGILFDTKDFVHYSEGSSITLEEHARLRAEHGLGTAASAQASDTDKTGEADAAQAAGATLAIGNIEGCIPVSTLEIPADISGYLRKKLGDTFSTGVFVPEEIEAQTPEDLQKQKVRLVNSEGTAADKRVNWDLSKDDISKPGKYPVTGELYVPHFEFPVAFNRADPCVTRWNGHYYFIATNDADNNHTLYMRTADRLEDLATAEEHLILDSTTYEGIGGLLWAPEFHEVEGRLYIFHAATPGEFFWEESHIMELREGGDPICREDWSRPKRVVKADGTDICEAGKEITLDMTCFPWEGEYYVVWSQRQFLPIDMGAYLYIATLNPEKPWMLKSDPVLLSKPEYGWANNHTFVDEGPFALMRDDRLFLTFSSAAVDTSYVVGLLQNRKGRNLLDPTTWTKTGYPLMTSRSLEGEFGTGHNAYVEDEDGTIWNTYHARPGTEGVRSSGIRRVHFDCDGEPRLDLNEEMDVKPALRSISTTVVVA